MDVVAVLHLLADQVVQVAELSTCLDRVLFLVWLGLLRLIVLAAVEAGKGEALAEGAQGGPHH